jgi:hypothetical protein
MENIAEKTMFYEIHLEENLDSSCKCNFWAFK